MYSYYITFSFGRYYLLLLFDGLRLRAQWWKGSRCKLSASAVRIWSVWDGQAIHRSLMRCLFVERDSQRSSRSSSTRWWGKKNGTSPTADKLVAFETDGSPSFFFLLCTAQQTFLCRLSLFSLAGRVVKGQHSMDFYITKAPSFSLLNTARSPLFLKPLSSWVISKIRGR